MDSFEAEVLHTVKKRRKSDLKEVIQTVLKCPTLHDGDVELVDGSKPIGYYLEKNIDVMTRIVLVQATSAGNGDIKSAEFLMKYGDYTPAQEHTISVIPAIIDDLSMMPAPSPALPSADEEEEPLTIEIRAEEE